MMHPEEPDYSQENVLPDVLLEQVTKGEGSYRRFGKTVGEASPLYNEAMHRARILGAVAATTYSLTHSSYDDPAIRRMVLVHQGIPVSSHDMQETDILDFYPNEYELRYEHIAAAAAGIALRNSQSKVTHIGEVAASAGIAQELFQKSILVLKKHGYLTSALIGDKGPAKDWTLAEFTDKSVKTLAFRNGLWQRELRTQYDTQQHPSTLDRPSEDSHLVRAMDMAEVRWRTVARERAKVNSLVTEQYASAAANARLVAGVCHLLRVPEELSHFCENYLNDLPLEQQNMLRKGDVQTYGDINEPTVVRVASLLAVLNGPEASSTRLIEMTGYSNKTVLKAIATLAEKGFTNEVYPSGLGRAITQGRQAPTLALTARFALEVSQNQHWKLPILIQQFAEESGFSYADAPVQGMMVALRSLGMRGSIEGGA